MIPKIFCNTFSHKQKFFKVTMRLKAILQTSHKLFLKKLIYPENN